MSRTGGAPGPWKALSTPQLAVDLRAVYEAVSNLADTLTDIDTMMLPPGARTSSARAGHGA